MAEALKHYVKYILYDVFVWNVHNKQVHRDINCFNVCLGLGVKGVAANWYIFSILSE